jgi:Beta-propeller repeat/S-layer homology domain
MQQATAVAQDASGNTYIAGFTDAASFPVVNSAFSAGGGVDAFVMKLDPSWNVLFSTCLGGSGNDRASAIGVDAQGNIYVAGSTTSSSIAGTALSRSGGAQDGFVVKLNPTGSTVLYAFAVGGSSSDSINAMVVRSDGTVFAAGQTSSTNLPVVSAAQSTLRGVQNAFAIKLDPSGTVVYCTYVGGSGSDGANGIAVDGNGIAWIAGGTTSNNFPLKSPLLSARSGTQTGFATRLSANGSQILFSTYLGGSGGGPATPESANAVAVDAQGNAFVAGVTSSTDFPVRGAWQSSYGGFSDAFLSSFDSGGNLRFSTYLGGGSWDYGYSVVVLSDGSVAVSGDTLSSDFPVTSSEQAWHAGGYVGFVAVFDNAGDQVPFASYLAGGPSNAVLASTNTNPMVVAGIQSNGSPPVGTLVAAAAVTIPSVAQFADVPPSDQFFDAVNLLYDAGVTVGCGQSDSPQTRRYCPTSSITRAQMATLIVRAVTGEGTPAIYNPTPYFQDEPASDQYFPYVQKLMDLDITIGCSQNPPRYCPSDPVPRWQMAIFMVRARLALYGAGFSSSPTPYFGDVPSNAVGGSFPFIQRAYEENVTGGCGRIPLQYCPDEAVTREQMAAFMMRGLFNETMYIGPTAPYLTGASPHAVTLTAGTAITVTITGVNTSFQSGDTVSVPSGMLGVSNVVVNSARSITATLTVNGNAVAGPQALVVTSGGQNLTWPLAVKVGTY